MKKFKGFSLAEMMVVMLIVSIILAASAPIVTRKLSRQSQNPTNFWTRGKTDFDYIADRITGKPHFYMDIRENGKISLSNEKGNHESSVLFGNNTVKEGTKKIIAIGFNTQNSGANSITIGSNTKATGNYSTAIGYGASAIREHTIVLGTIFDAVHIPGIITIKGIGNLAAYLQNLSNTIIEHSEKISEQQKTIVKQQQAIEDLTNRIERLEQQRNNNNCN